MKTISTRTMIAAACFVALGLAAGCEPGARVGLPASPAAEIDGDTDRTVDPEALGFDLDETRPTRTCQPRPGGWSRLQSPGDVLDEFLFATDQAKPVWTGSEVFVLGTYSYACRPSCPFGVKALAFDPATETWRFLADPNIPEGSAVQSLWTGAEWILFGPFDEEGFSGRIYLPSADGWTEIPPPPMEIRALWPAVAFAPSTKELIVWGGGRTREGGSRYAYEDLEGSNHGAAWSTVTRTWRRIPDSILSPRANSTGIWDGERLIFVFGELVLAGLEGSRAVGGAAAFDPVTNEWELLPDPPVNARMIANAWGVTDDSSFVGFFGGWESTGDGDFYPYGHDAATWNRRTRTWKASARTPYSSFNHEQFTSWANDEGLTILKAFDDDEGLPAGAKWDAKSSEWTVLSEHAGRPKYRTHALWTGCETVFFPGGLNYR